MASALGGVLSIFDTQHAQVPALKYGMDAVYKEVGLALQYHNAKMEDMVRDLVEKSPDALRRYDGYAAIKMSQVGEFGMAPAQKVVAGTNIGFPLRNYQANSTWTRRYLQHATVGDLAKDVNLVLDADVRNVCAEITKTIFNDDNTTEVDQFGSHPGIDLPVKAFYNADSGPIALGPNGETFDGSTHTHFAAATPFTTTEMDNLITNVAEHALGMTSGSLRVYINTAEEATVVALTGFKAAVDLANVVPSLNADRAVQPLSFNNRWNRYLGTYKGAAVWVKPWIPAGYLFCFDAVMDPKPLLWRTPGEFGSDGLMMIFQAEADFPSTVKLWERSFGLGVWGRQNGAIHRVNASYAEPTVSDLS